MPLEEWAILAARQHTNCFVTWPPPAGVHMFPPTTKQYVRDDTKTA